MPLVPDMDAKIAHTPKSILSWYVSDTIYQVLNAYIILIVWVNFCKNIYIKKINFSIRVKIDYLLINY